MVSMKDIDKLKKGSLLTLEISPNTKTSIVNSDLNQLVTNLKRVGAKKDVIVLVFTK
jgi:anionic cell wall polymer biosynthesis LytR-Cps2A-Psr (LCP) family protein